MLTCSSLRPLSSVIQEARRKHANQDVVATGRSHVPFATMTPWVDHVAAELLVRTKRQLHRTHVMVFSAKQAVIARRTTERDMGGLHCRRRERGGGGCDRTWACRRKLCLEGLLSLSIFKLSPSSDCESPDASLLLYQQNKCEDVSTHGGQWT